MLFFNSPVPYKLNNVESDFEESVRKTFSFPMYNCHALSVCLFCNLTLYSIVDKNSVKRLSSDMNFIEYELR
jgi:hypothetical protein